VHYTSNSQFFGDQHIWKSPTHSFHILPWMKGATRRATRKFCNIRQASLGVCSSNWNWVRYTSNSHFFGDQHIWNSPTHSFHIRPWMKGATRRATRKLSNIRQALLGVCGCNWNWVRYTTNSHFFGDQHIWNSLTDSFYILPWINVSTRRATRKLCNIRQALLGVCSCNWNWERYTTN
jgi:hypothetical protein